MLFSAGIKLLKTFPNLKLFLKMSDFIVYFPGRVCLLYRQKRTRLNKARGKKCTKYNYTKMLNNVKADDLFMGKKRNHPR